VRTKLLHGSMWYKNGNAYALLQLQELEPHAWLTGAWQEPDEQVHLVMNIIISGTLAMNKWHSIRRVAVAVGLTASLVDEGGGLMSDGQRYKRALSSRG